MSAASLSASCEPAANVISAGTARFSRRENTVVTIADSRFFIAVFTLIVSLAYHRVRTGINVLSLGLSTGQKNLLEQFRGVTVYEADPLSTLGPAARKGEAILTAEAGGSDYVTLLDGDCIVTGDITPDLTPGGDALFARLKSPDEDGRVFARRYEPRERPGTIPRRILETWRADVGERDRSAVSNTVCGGNLTVHRSQLPFIRKWQRQIDKVLPSSARGAHDFGSHAYSQMDESVLNSLLAFAYDAPEVRRAQLDTDPAAFVAHLGPNSPKPWVLWRPERLRYFGAVATMIAWAEREGYAMPTIPWTFRARNRVWVYLCAYIFAFLRWGKHLVDVSSSPWRLRPPPGG
jgi:hypothetical protein